MSHLGNFGRLLSPKKIPWTQWVPISLLPLATRCLLSVSIDLPILDMIYKWNPMIFGLLWLTFLLSVLLLKCFHVLACISTSLFKNCWIMWPVIIPHLVYLFISWQDIWVVFHLWLLPVILLWTLMYKYLCAHTYLFHLVIYLRMKLLGHMATLCLTVENC